MNKPSKRIDRSHLRAGYALISEGLDELLQVYRKDNIIAHAVRVLGASVDTLYEYINAA